MQSQVRFNRGSGEGSEEGLGGFGAKPSQVKQRFRRSFRRRSGRLRCRARSCSTGFRRRFDPGGFGAEPGQVQQGSGKAFGEGLGGFSASQVKFNRIRVHLTQGNPAEAFPALGFAACFRKICKNKTLQQLGIPPKFFLDTGLC